MNPLLIPLGCVGIGLAVSALGGSLLVAFGLGLAYSCLMVAIQERGR